MKWKVGDTTITKIQEIVYPEFSDVIPAATPEVVKQVKWLFPHFVTEEGHLSLSIHSLIIDTSCARTCISITSAGIRAWSMASGYRRSRTPRI